MKAARYPQANISFEQLLERIKNNKDKKKILAIREKVLNGDGSYEDDKMRLPIVTPCGSFSYRNKKNLIQASGYLYLDLDHDDNGIIDIQGFKSEIINRHKDIIAACCLSVSGRGLTIFIRTEPTITNDNILNALDYVKGMFNGYGYVFDKKVSDMPRAWFVSYDPEVYYNPDAFIKIPEEILEKVQQAILKSNIDNTVCCTLSEKKERLIPFDELMKQISLKTLVDTEDEQYIIKPTDYYSVYIPRNIYDGKKRAPYSQMIHQLVAIQYDITRLQVRSFINWVNSNYARGGNMNFKQLCRLCDNVLHTAKCQKLMAKGKTKMVHFSKDCGLTKNEKHSIAVKVNGRIKSDRYRDAIQDVYDTLCGMSEKPTQQKIAEMSGIGIRTVKEHWSEIKKVQQAILKSNIDNTVCCTLADENTDNMVRDTEDNDIELPARVLDEEYSDELIWEHLEDEFFYLYGEDRLKKIQQVRDVLKQQAA